MDKKCRKTHKKVQNIRKSNKKGKNQCKRPKLNYKNGQKLFSCENKKWIGLCSSELIFDCGWEYSFFLDVLASKRSGVSCSDSSVGSYFKGLVLVEFVLVSFSSSRLVGFQVLISKQQEVSGSVRKSSDPLSIPCVVTYTLNICVVKPQLCWPVCCSACVTCMWVYQSIRLLIFRLAIKCCAVRGYRLPFTWFVPACLPPFTALWWWVLLVYYVLREMWFLFFFYFFACTIMCAFPMYYVSRTTKTLNNQKKTPVERKISLFL